MLIVWIRWFVCFWCVVDCCCACWLLFSLLWAIWAARCFVVGVPVFGGLGGFGGWLLLYNLGQVGCCGSIACCTVCLWLVCWICLGVVFCLLLFDLVVMICFGFVFTGYCLVASGC